MTVTRREMLTATSAIGLTTALSPNVTADDNAEQGSAEQYISNLTIGWDTITQNEDSHLKAAAKLIRKSGHFPNFNWKDLVNFYITQSNYRPIVRGLYAGGYDPQNMEMVYAIRDPNTNDPPNVEFTIHSFGGSFLNPAIAADLLRADMKLHFVGSGPHRAKIHYRFIIQGTPLGDILTHILHHGTALTFTLVNDGTPTHPSELFTLTIY